MRRVALNALVLSGVNVSGAGLNFLLSLVIARALGVEDFGRYTFALAWTFALGQFAEFGLNTLLTRELARRPDAVAGPVSAANWIKSALALVLAGGLWLGAPALSGDAHTGAALALAAPLVWLNALYGSYTAVFRAAQRMTPILLLNAGGLLLQLLLTLFVVAQGGDLSAVLAVALGANGAQLLAAYALYRARFYAGSSGAVDLSLVKRMARAAIPFAIAGVLGAIELRASVVLLGTLGAQREVGLFGAAGRWAEAARILPYGFLGALFPALSAQAVPAQVEQTFLRAARALLAYALLSALVLSLAAPVLLALSYGADFAAASGTLQVLAWLSVPMLINTASELALYALGDEQFVNGVTACGLAVQFVLALPLIHAYGAAGAALSVCAGEGFVLLPLWLRRVRRVQGAQASEQCATS